MKFIEGIAVFAYCIIASASARAYSDKFDSRFRLTYVANEASAPDIANIIVTHKDWTQYSTEIPGRQGEVTAMGGVESYDSLTLTSINFTTNMMVVHNFNPGGGPANVYTTWDQERISVRPDALNSIVRAENCDNSPCVVIWCLEADCIDVVGHTKAEHIDQLNNIDLKREDPSEYKTGSICIKTQTSAQSESLATEFSQLIKLSGGAERTGPLAISCPPIP